MLRTFYFIVLWASAAALLLGQAISAPQIQTTSAPGSMVSATSEEVLMDVVVRDKKGRAVKNLKPDDVRVFDNGQAKTIKSFRLIDGNEAVASGGARTPLEPPHRVRSVMMVFQCHHDDARRLETERNFGEISQVRLGGADNIRSLSKRCDRLRLPLRRRRYRVRASVTQAPASRHRLLRPPQ